MLERELTESKKEWIERSNLNLHILARLIKLVMNEAEDRSEIVLNEKLHDQNLVLRIVFIENLLIFAIRSARLGLVG